MTAELEHMLRIEGGRVLATLIRHTGDISVAEDAVQDALVQALERWPRTGMPRNPAAWLTAVARNNALDRWRRESRRPRKELDAALLSAPVRATSESAVGDDLLRLLFTCCHPALAADARVALALRTIGGLSTTEIARAFLQPEPTVGQRISRAKKKIASAAIPYRIPSDAELPERLPAVLSVIYLVFTTGHHSPQGRLDARVDLAEEGVRLARLVARLMPREPECAGLLSLVLATHARRRARLDEEGAIVLMADQDRTRWDHAAVAEAAALLDRAIAVERPGPFQTQAAIACLHGLAETYADTDWRQIAELYARLELQQPTAVVRVNRAIAAAEAFGPASGLRLLDGVDLGVVGHWHLYWSARAWMLERLDRPTDAMRAYDAALACPANDSDRRLLESRRRRAAAAASPADPGPGSDQGAVVHD